MSPERDLAEDPADRSRLVTPARVRQRIERVAGGVKAAVAVRAGHGMGRDRLGERVLVPPAFGDDRAAVRPGEVVQHRTEPEPGRRLAHDPGAPAGDGPARFAKCSTELHQRAFASRASAG